MVEQQHSKGSLMSILVKMVQLWKIKNSTIKAKMPFYQSYEIILFIYYIFIQ